MSDALIGFATYPGVGNVLAANFTISHGITPSVCQIELTPQIGLPALDGTLAFWWGTVGIGLLPLLQFPGCRLDLATVERTPSGLINRISVVDRRWRWRFGEISGSANVRLDDQTLDPRFKATTETLATLCLQAMGEDSFDLSGLANVAAIYPEVNWDHDNPALALQQMIEPLGCRIVLSPLTNTVKIVQMGVGVAPPDSIGPIMSRGEGAKIPERPDGLKVVCGKSRFQYDFFLEAVGQDVDGTIQLIDDLSYAPSGGWQFETPGYFGGISSEPVGPQNTNPQQLARDTVYRWYRIAIENLDGSPISLAIDGTGNPTTDVQFLRQILPIEDVQVQKFVDTFDPDNPVRSLPAMVYGTHADELLSFANSDPREPIQANFSIDREKGIVKFDTHIYRYLEDEDDSAGQGFDSADLYLRVACGFKDADSFAAARAELTYDFPDNPQGTGYKQLKHDEIVFLVVANTTQDPETGIVSVDGWDDNAELVAAEADLYLTAAQFEYQITGQEDVTFAGLAALDLDGIVQQITWVVGGPEATTRVGVNCEFSTEVVPFRQRRLFEDLRDNAVRNLKDQVSDLVRNADSSPSSS
jgi:hypothetical protein